MKRLFLFAAALIMAASFNACTDKSEIDGDIENNGGDNNDNNDQDGDENNGSDSTPDIKLVKSIKSSTTSDDFEFEYDSQNRLVKAKIWGTVYHYSYNGDTMTVTNSEEEYVMKLNADGFVTSFDFDGDSNVSNTYNNGYVSKITTTWDKYDVRYNDFAWNNGLLSSITTTYYDDTDFLIKWSFSYDTVQPAPINIDIIHLFFDPFADDFGVACFGFFGKQSKLYPVKVDLDDDGDKYEISVDYKFNEDGTIAKATVNWSGEDDDTDYETFEFTY